MLTRKWHWLFTPIFDGISALTGSTRGLQERNALQKGGIGAQIHTIGAALAAALDLGRVLLLEYDSESTLFTEDTWCGAVFSGTTA